MKLTYYVLRFIDKEADEITEKGLEIILRNAGRRDNFVGFDVVNNCLKPVRFEHCIMWEKKEDAEKHMKDFPGKYEMMSVAVEINRIN